MGGGDSPESSPVCHGFFGRPGIRKSSIRVAMSVSERTRRFETIKNTEQATMTRNRRRLVKPKEIMLQTVPGIALLAEVAHV